MNETSEAVSLTNDVALGSAGRVNGRRLMCGGGEGFRQAGPQPTCPLGARSAPPLPRVACGGRTLG